MERDRNVPKQEEVDDSTIKSLEVYRNRLRLVREPYHDFLEQPKPGKCVDFAQVEYLTPCSHQEFGQGYDFEFGSTRDFGGHLQIFPDARVALVRTEQFALELRGITEVREIPDRPDTKEDVTLHFTSVTEEHSTYYSTWELAISTMMFHHLETGYLRPRPNLPGS
jgi:hypothetical protein